MLKYWKVHYLRKFLKIMLMMKHLLERILLILIHLTQFYQRHYKEEKEPVSFQHQWYCHWKQGNLNARWAKNTKFILSIEIIRIRNDNNTYSVNQRGSVKAHYLFLQLPPSRNHPILGSYTHHWGSLKKVVCYIILWQNIQRL